MATNERIALVTGAGSGIGRASALALHAAGYSVALAGRRVAELEKTAAKADGGPGRMLVVGTDVSRPDSVNALFAKVKGEFGRLDVLFNNAGLNAPGIPIEDLPFEKWSAIVDVNLTGVFLCLKHEARWMLEHGVFPTVDTFSHSAPGTPWTAFEWLSELAMLGVYRAGGWAGLVAMAACCFGLTLGHGQHAKAARGHIIQLGQVQHDFGQLLGGRLIDRFTHAIGKFFPARFIDPAVHGADQNPIR